MVKDKHPCWWFWVETLYYNFLFMITIAQSNHYIAVVHRRMFLTGAQLHKEGLICIVGLQHVVSHPCLGKGRDLSSCMMCSATVKSPPRRSKLESFGRCKASSFGACEPKDSRGVCLVNEGCGQIQADAVTRWSVGQVEYLVNRSWVTVKMVRSVDWRSAGVNDMFGE